MPLPDAWFATGKMGTGHGGVLWFDVRDTEAGQAMLGRLGPDGFSAHPLEGGVTGVAAGPDGHVWISVWGAGVVARVTPNGDVVEKVATAGSPNGIAVGTDGNVWFVDGRYDYVGRIRV